jgi:hypothetical protein
MRSQLRRRDISVLIDALFHLQYDMHSVLLNNIIKQALHLLIIQLTYIVPNFCTIKQKLDLPALQELAF